MYLGRTLFSQLVDFLPWKIFHRTGAVRLRPAGAIAFARQAVPSHVVCPTNLPRKPVQH